MTSPCLHSAAAAIALAGLAAASPATSARAASGALCTEGGPPMVVGYFDHTAAWYRRQTRMKSGQIAALAWKPPPQGGIVVLYSDVSAVKSEEDDGGVAIEQLRARMKEREADIGGYLDAAGKNDIKVRIQVPPDIVTRWSAGPQVREVLAEFVERWSRHPATAGFYVFDEPELDDIPASTLAEVAAVIREHAPQSTLSMSVASSAVAENKMLLRAYATAEPRIFDELLVNRYPVYRAYGAGSAKGGAGMGGKLGLQAEKAGRENLADNEFQNLGDYYDSLVASTKVPGLAGRPVYASVQAYGLRDDCDGPQCKATRERKARRSPTWNELLYMYASVWMSGVDGAVLYSRYFSQYDGALRRRLDNLESLMGPVFGALPGCRPDAGVRTVNASRKAGLWAPASVLARLAVAPGAGRPGYLVVLNKGRGRARVHVQLDGAAGVTKAEELRFDAQGAPLEPEAAPLEGSGGEGRALLLDLPGTGVRLFRLGYD
jgi:hypothetical protein